MVRLAFGAGRSATTTGGAPAIVRSRVLSPRFSHSARIASALRWILDASLARFGMESRLENSARILRSWFARQTRVSEESEEEWAPRSGVPHRNRSRIVFIFGWRSSQHHRTFPV